jgi:pimeloyl-ACP methyl ester carboxylesterase
MTLPAGLALPLVVVGLTLAVPAQAIASCYIAFVHGSGEDLHEVASGLAGAEIDRYWQPGDRADASFITATERSSGCVVWRIGYDGNQQWWSDRAAGKVAASLHDFIEHHAIPDGALTIVGHSMGGLVARYVVNSGAPSAPYYNEYIGWDSRMDYDLVRRKTARIISVQAPHTGTQSADALFGRADHRVTNTGASLIKVMGWRDITNATGVMTRPYMEAAGSPGGEMGDEGREVPLYTVAGYDTGEASGTGMEDDDKLDLAWVLLCYKRGASNSWGAACRWDVWNFQTLAGDGLVELSSSHGYWLRGSANGRVAILGARQPWLDIVHNHNQGRYDLLSGHIRNFITPDNTFERLGSYIGSHLP